MWGPALKWQLLWIPKVRLKIQQAMQRMGLLLLRRQVLRRQVLERLERRRRLELLQLLWWLSAVRPPGYLMLLMRSQLAVLLEELRFR